ncbi:amino acid transporter [Stemphylium lycopersici]|uniref:Amino acid transporter n=1 Tax=Stemphylium lycopersici TaxID=183478 RepID=A0A364MXK7_STELY|nr:amino acid transporter [Stemphylium lycopersici]RAR11937.1 amino acid transporter [Stemphylium lycopersici]
MEDNVLKGPAEAIDYRNSIELANITAVGENNGTHGDENDMDRSLKGLRNCQRQFKFLSIFGFAMILGNSWEYSLIGIGISLFNGGPAGGIWMLVVVCFGMFFVTLSFAEMVSMAPTAGGQYHWVSELAPKKHQRFLSYVVGWLCVIGWQTGMASTAYAVTQQLQGLIALNMPQYVIEGWHGTLFSIAIVMCSILWNTILVKKLPLMEGIALVLHIFGFFAFIVVLWVMGPRSNTKEVWTKFEDPSGWGNTGLATLVGILGPILTLGGADLAVHLAEEVKDAAYVTPRAMVATAIVNYSLAFVMTVTVFSTLGNDLTAILSTPLGQPWIQILLNATESIVATNVMTVAICLLLLFCSVNQVTACSRQIWSFARDQGLPYSAWLAYVPPGWDIPVNSVMFTFVFSSLVCLIIIGSSIAFNIILSLSGVAIFTSNIIVIGCMFVKRLRGEPLLPSRFDLGRAGLVVNGIALCYLAIAVVFILFPSVPNPSLIDMNWSCVIFGCFAIFSMGYYYLYGKHSYKGPVEYVKRSI